MPTVTKEAVFAAAADDVWAIVREFGRLDDWLPPVVVCRTDRDGIGALRTLTLGDGAVVVERLEALDDAARTLTYSMTDAGPMPLVDYVSTIAVRANVDGTATMKWSGSFGVSGADEGEVVASIEGLYQTGLDSVGEKLAG
ncbi:MAG: SRPBCC family protein [Rhodospirillaceae bacterium]|nr:SRPBCC family protein [Rhodospirillaceae bacterium]MXW90893.1 SRPBCC family protein [Rhodospirillaceae bacterium]MYB15302.1 SRPBCC family protein [Rhodospirillaceae bacterium]MYI50663.1 SRPBCC family protein [Rhodospirillaceae bacterium]